MGYIMKKELSKAIEERIAKKIDFNSISLSKKDYMDSEILMYDECSVNDFR
jgi:hypothetical protein